MTHAYQYKYEGKQPILPKYFLDLYNLGLLQVHRCHLGSHKINSQFNDVATHIRDKEIISSKSSKGFLFQNSLTNYKEL
jgi:hypothetical protein